MPAAPATSKTARAHRRRRPMNVQRALFAASLVIVLAAVGCAASDDSCPPGSSRAGCPPPDAVDAGRDASEAPPDPCVGMAAGATCGEGLRCSAAGACTCGNATADPGEACDDGTNATGSGCEPSCVFTCEADADCSMPHGACV